MPTADQITKALAYFARAFSTYVLNADKSTVQADVLAGFDAIGGTALLFALFSKIKFDAALGCPAPNCPRVA